MIMTIMMTMIMMTMVFIMMMRRNLTLTQSAPKGFSQGLFQRSFVKLSISHLVG